MDTSNNRRRFNASNESQGNTITGAFDKYAAPDASSNRRRGTGGPSRNGAHPFVHAPLDAPPARAAAHHGGSGSMRAVMGAVSPKKKQVVVNPADMDLREVLPSDLLGHGIGSRRTIRVNGPPGGQSSFSISTMFDPPNKADTNASYNIKSKRAVVGGGIASVGF